MGGSPEWTRGARAAGVGGARRSAAGPRCSPARRWRHVPPAAGSGSAGSWTGSPTGYGSPGMDPPSSGAARTASPAGGREVRARR